jgi:Tol biopolymer transport system component
LLSAPALARGPAVQFIASTYREESAQYSPDVKRITFESASSRVQSIWISDADGSHALELFSRAGGICGTPRWSPDGQRIAFDFTTEGNMDVYVIRASGGIPIHLTTDRANDTLRAGRETVSGSTLRLIGLDNMRFGRYQPQAERLFR